MQLIQKPLPKVFLPIGLCYQQQSKLMPKMQLFNICFGNNSYPKDELKFRVATKNNLSIARSLPFIIWYFLTFKSKLILRIVVTIFHLTPCTLPKWLNQESELLTISSSLVLTFCRRESGYTPVVHLFQYVDTFYNTAPKLTSLPLAF